MGIQIATATYEAVRYETRSPLGQALLMSESVDEQRREAKLQEMEQERWADDGGPPVD